MDKEIYNKTRHDLTDWQDELKNNILTDDSHLAHSFQIYFNKDETFLIKLKQFSNIVSYFLEPLVCENNLSENLPSLAYFNAIGEKSNEVLHHPSYIEAGNIIYGSKLMQYLLEPGNMIKTLALFILSSHAGEAGHNCPIACSAGLMRVLANYSKLPETEIYLNKFAEKSFTTNYTGAQFLTEIQGGSDVGANATIARQNDKGEWRIHGEKWFCSNANADLILLTARTNENTEGTKGLSLFLVPAKLKNGEDNFYNIKRLKQKLGTRTMATAEIDFIGALAYPMGELNEGIHLALGHVLHLSRIFNAFSVLGMARRAFQTAYLYAKHRKAFGKTIVNFPLVKEHLALIRADNTAMIAASFNLVNEQDKFDLSKSTNKEKALLLRTLANINKYFTAKRSVENIHHSIDILAGNGIVESFSSLPRLLRDTIICENWEGTHFTLWMQTLRDIEKFAVDKLFLSYLEELLTELKITEKNRLNEAMKDLINQFDNLKKLSPDLQSLAMANLIDKMAALYSAICLALEIKVLDSKSKNACLSFFIETYLVDKPIEKNKDYLKLVEAVLS
ncbi:MAG: acyl-CoA dehydrogenase family protein [Proteobacteria bacterium]|nr:acyl-CoA dehydrogenase family protein [Pseudomonadota bacterium]